MTSKKKSQMAKKIKGHIYFTFSGDRLSKGYAVAFYGKI